MINKAYKFALEAHEAVGQLRKYTKEPYIVHPANVARFVSSVTRDKEVIQAAYLHDTVEDTLVTFGDIEKHFGARVRRLVADVTKVSTKDNGLRIHRIALDHKHYAMASANGKSIKLADMIDNMPSIIEFDPKFAIKYMAEKRELLPLLDLGHPTLYTKAQGIINAYYAQTDSLEISA